jgi:hypothetical protein
MYRTQSEKTKKKKINPTEDFVFLSLFFSLSPSISLTILIANCEENGYYLHGHILKP